MLQFPSLSVRAGDVEGGGVSQSINDNVELRETLCLLQRKHNLTRKLKQERELYIYLHLLRHYLLPPEVQLKNWSYQSVGRRSM